MSRAALTQVIGNPFLTHIWCTLYEKVWKNEVDKLYVTDNCYPWIPEPVRNYCVDRYKELANVVIVPSDWENNVRVDHGDAIRLAAEACQEDLVMLIEDDGLIFKQGIVDKCFKRIESTEVDLVGSPRGSACQELLNIMEKTFRLQKKRGARYQTSPHWWPNFLFLKLKDMLATDRNYNAKNWKKGDRLECLNYTVVGDTMSGDTFSWASVQLRCMGVRDGFVQQYKSYPQDLQLREQKTHIWDGKCPWIHLGSCSEFIVSDDRSIFQDRDDFAASVQRGAFGLVRDPSSRQEYTRKFGTALMGVQMFPTVQGDLLPWIELAIENLGTLFSMPEIKMEEVKKHASAYEELLAPSM